MPVLLKACCQVFAFLLLLLLREGRSGRAEGKTKRHKESKERLMKKLGEVKGSVG